MAVEHHHIDIVEYLNKPGVSLWHSTTEFIH